MPFRTVCPNCQAPYKLPDAMNGKKVRCAKCQNAMVAVPIDEPPEYEVLEVAEEEPVEAVLPKGKPSKRREYDEEENDYRTDEDDQDAEEDLPQKKKRAKAKKRSRGFGKLDPQVAAVAFFQKAILLCILGNIAAGILLQFLPRTLGLVLFLPVICASLTSTVFTFMLARSLYGNGLGIFVGILTLVPLVGLFTLLVMNQKATGYLRDNGVEVGFLGAKTPGGSGIGINPAVLGIGAGVLLLVVGGGFAVTYFVTRDADGPWPELPVAPLRGPDNEIRPDVTLHIAGVGDEYTYGTINRKLGALSDPPNQRGVMSARKGDRMSARVTSTDPQATANKVDFGTVRRVSGRTITIDATAISPPPENDEVAKALYDIRGPLPVPRREAFKRLKEMKPNERRDEVVKELTTMVTKADQFDRGFALEALAVWGGKDSLPTILSALDSKDHFLRRQAIPILASFKDERVIEPLAKFLDELGLRAEAVKALKEYGSGAEKAVAQRLSSSDTFVRRAACDILKDIGTAESIPELDKLAKNRNDRGVAILANNTIKAIKARQ